MVQNKIQIDEKDFEFIKKAYKALSYKSLSHYMREAVRAKVREDRKKWKALQRLQAIEQIGQGSYENLFDSLEGEDFVLSGSIWPRPLEMKSRKGGRS